MTVPARRTNVVDAATPVLGRADALLALERHFANGRRLVTVMGPPGVGKSRLALAFAAELFLARYPGGIWSCDLDGCASAEELCARVLATLTATFEPARLDGRAQVTSTLCRGGPTFLLFDNVESSLSALAALLEAWLRAAPGLTCLVTSRERVGLRAEASFVLGPLDEDGAIALFRARCEAVRSELALTDPIVLRAIVRQLDCMPLAIELAAEHVRALNPTELLGRLDPSMPFLSSSDRTGPPRTRCMRAALDSSLHGLAAVERRTWLALSQFRGEFDLTDAEAAFEDTATPTAVVLTRLSERSLLWVTASSAGSRYRLPRAAREYAAELLAEDSGAGALRERFLNALSKRARCELDREDDVGSLSWACRHAETLLASACAFLDAGALESALEALVVASYAAAFQGPIGPVLRVLESTSLEATQDPRLRCRALRARGRLRARNGQRSSALADFEAAHRLLRPSSGWLELRVSLAIDLGNHHRHCAAWERAQTFFAEALEACASEGEERGRARALAAIAGMAHERSELLQAREDYEKALSAARQHALPLQEATILQNLGILLQELGLRNDAAACFREAIEAHRRLGHRRFEGIAEYDLASLALEQDALGEATAGLERASKLASEVGDRRELGLSLALLAVCHALTQELETATREMDAAESVLRTLGEPALLLAIQIHRAHLDLAGGLRDLEAGDASARTHKLAAVLETLSLARAATGASDAPSKGPAVAGDEARYALRVLESCYRRQLALSQYALVDTDGRWFQPAGGERVDLRNRIPLQRLLGALIHRRMEAPDEPVPADELIRAGWPGEKSVTKAAKNRLHVAVTTLRKSGLDAHLVHTAGGYRLARTMPWHKPKN